MSSRADAAVAVPSGYSRTEVGVIPEAWNVTAVGDVADVKTGPFGSSLHERDYVEEGTPIVTVEHLGEFGLVHENLPLVSELDKLRLKSYTLRPNDVVFSRVGSVDRNSVIREAETGWLFSGRLLRVRVTSPSVHPPFLSYHFHSEPFKRRVRSVAVGQAMASLNTQILRGILIVVPTMPEQRAIANALSDADKLIESSDKLIAKKRAIKQAAMQQLLTGKIRLPGFREHWRNCRLDDLGPFSKGRGIKRDDVADEGVGCIRYGEIYTRYNEYLLTPLSRVPQPVAAQALRITKGDLLFAGSGETAGEIGKCVAYLGDEEAYAGGDIVVHTPSEQDSLYLGYLLNHETVAKQKARLGQGDAVVHISAKSLGRLELHLPTLEEQRAIATVLSDMDTEIVALERRLSKTKAIKQGMMQSLLTGRVRLRYQETAA